MAKGFYQQTPTQHQMAQQQVLIQQPTQQLTFGATQTLTMNTPTASSTPVLPAPQPSNMGLQQPSSMGLQQPSNMGLQQPSSMGQQQPLNMVYHQPSHFILQHPSNVIYQQPSNMVYQQPQVQQLPYQQHMAHQQPNYQPIPIYYQESGIKLPQFDGNPRNFRRWWQILNILYNEPIPDVHKMILVLESLVGKARMVAEGFDICAENLMPLLNNLHQQFGQPDKIINALYAAYHNVELHSSSTEDSTRMVNELENLLRQLQVNGVNIDNGSLQYVYDNKLPKWLKAKAYASGIPTTFQELRQKVQEQLVIATELDQSNKKKHVAVNVTSYFQQVTIQPQMPFQQQMTYQPIQQFQQPVYQQIPVYQINHEHWETAEEEGKPKDLPENEKYFIHDMPKDSIEPENDEDNTSKLLIEEKMEENMDENILAFCQDLPKDKLDIFQAEDYGKSTFQAENDENSTYLYEIKDDIEEPSMNEPVKWKMTNLNPGRIKNGEEKILYETMDSNGKFLPDERIKCKMKPKAVEDTVTKDNSNIWMEKETNPPVTKAEKCWKQIKKKIKADFGKFKHAWKKKQQNLNLQWKKKNQQTSGFKKEAKEKENELIKNSEKWKLKKIDLWKQPNELIKKARIKMKQFLKAGEGLRQAQFSIPNLSKWSEMKFRHTNPDVQKEMIWTTPTPKQKLEWQLFTDEFSILHRQNGLELKPEVNDVIKDEEVPRGSWKMGRITKLQKSKDGRIREVSVLTKSGTLHRSPSHLYPLEANIDQPDTKAEVNCLNYFIVADDNF